MHLHIPALPDTKGSIGCLILHSRVPPAIKVKDMVGSGQIQSNAACFEREDKEWRPITLLLELLYHHITLLLGGATMQEEGLTIKGLLQMLAQQRAHLGKLGKD